MVAEESKRECRLILKAANSRLKAIRIMSATVGIGSNSRPSAYQRLINALRTDLLSSFIVFLVALPLCLGIAKACGLPPALGLLTGIVGGLLVGNIAGSPLQVSGPAAGLIVLVGALVREYPGRELTALGLVVLIAGGVQSIAGLLKVGQWFRAVAPAVIEGMLAGIGVLIFASQFHIMIDDSPRASGIANIAAIPESIGKALVGASDNGYQFAAWIGAVTIATLVLWKVFAPKKLQILPAPLIAVVLATALTAIRALPIKRVELPTSLFDAITLPGSGTLELLLSPAIWKSGLTFALVASSESLLCAAAVDQMHQGPRTKFDRELSAQGIGNIVCGMIGALPMTGVIVRSSANVDAGAKTRLSSILHGVWLLLLVMLAPDLLRLIPTACLAGILVYTGWTLVDVKEAKRLYRESLSEFLIYLATLVTVVTTDLLSGVILGIVLSAVKLLVRFSHLNIRVEDQPEKQRSTLYLEGAATFLRLPSLAATLEQVPPATHLHVHFERLSYIDHACLELLLNWEKQHEAVGGTLAIDWGALKARFHHPHLRRSDSQRRNAG
jgi:MFS superfamily sulfate permease-like transporter